jgi:hypothetical protein
MQAYPMPGVMQLQCLYGNNEVHFVGLRAFKLPHGSASIVRMGTRSKRYRIEIIGLSEGAALTYSWSFGDGTTGTGSTIAHTYIVPGNYPVILTVSDGNSVAIQALQVTVAGTTLVSGELDSDGDGISDRLELLAKTDPMNAGDAPIPGGLLVVDKAGVSLSFTSSTKDSIKASIRLIVPAGVTPVGSRFTVQFGGDTEEFTTPLDTKGSVSALNATLKVKAGAIAALSLGVKGKDLSDALAGNGLTDKTTAGDRITVPVGVMIQSATGAKYVFGGDVTLLYKATAGKGGKGAKAK